MIDKTMSITDVVEKYPQTAEVFFKHGLHCLGCMAAMFENIEQGALAHGINVDDLIKDLNKAIQ
jgi:hybrid cluster-associated redox disulfide protein